MSIGISDEHVELAASLRKWAASLDPVALVRAAEGEPAERFDAAWKAVEEMGVHAIAVPESAGGGGVAVSVAPSTSSANDCGPLGTL